ncbi:MAG TPA: flagellar hook-length control protein FliK [Steroidobacteraceae bacterium]|nr:flagellar hook-length control protein FliK [Steroidobacteraceae bacterium]
MIPVSKMPPATPGTAAPLPAGTPETPASPFDVILSLESLAATNVALDAGAIDGGALEELGEALRDERDDREADETEGEAEGPLAFLVHLLNMASVPSQPPPGSHTDAAADAVIDDASGGQGGQNAPADADTPAQAAQSARNPDARQVMTAVLAGDANAQAQTGATTDATQSADESTASLARAVEMLAHAPRHAAPVRDTIPTPTHSPRWADDFSARVAMMVRGGESSASLQLTPVDLGPVEVNVTVRDSQATIHFGAAQADTRALLEASIPRLREMLAAQGFNLMDASVSQGFARQARPDAPPPPRLDATPEAEVQATTRVTAIGLLDTYA